MVDLEKQTSVLSKRRLLYDSTDVEGKKTYIYEFILVPNIGFLGDSTPLLNDCEVKLNFDRTPGSVAVLSSQEIDTPYLEIKDCYATTEWVSSPSLKNYFAGIEYNPITYNYDEIEVLCKALPMNMTTMRLDNLRGGNVPSYMFAGIIPTDALNGDLALSSTNFGSHGITEINITMNGNSVDGYPIEVRNGSEVNAMFQFNDTINRIYNNKCCAGLKKAHFHYNYIWAHHFEAEQMAQGWIGMDIKLDKALTTSHTMVIWLVYENSVSIDKYHQVERM